MENHEGMDHGTMNEKSMNTSVVVETPDYSSVAAPVKEQIAALAGHYLELKEALVAANAQTAQTHAKAVSDAAEKMDVSALEGEQKAFAEEKLEEIKGSASKMAAASEVSEQRESLELLSEATFALTKAFGASEETLYYQHCPMANNDKGAYWMSNEKEIRNPYFGEKMLNCGSTEEVLQ